MMSRHVPIAIGSYLELRELSGIEWLFFREKNQELILEMIKIFR